MRRSHAVSTFLLLAFCAAAVGAWGSFTPRGQLYHGGADFARYVDGLGGLPDTSNSLFVGSGRCAGCHGEDPNDLASLAGQVYPAEPMPDAWDVNLVDHWRSSIMANSAKDPFWKAKVQHEVLNNPGHQGPLEDKCTSCHAPIGHFGAHHIATSDTLYSMAHLGVDSLAMDGVSCAICHQQAPEGLGSSFSGDLSFSTDTAYGPFGGGKDEYPVQWQPMFNFVGVMPMYGEHISRSEACAPCHSLLTSSVDLEGEYTGEQIVEQATFHEWLNSEFSQGGPTGIECQGCHMPQISDSVVLAAGYAWLQPRAPFSLHTFVGANTHMLQIFRENVDLLGLSATADEFDTTLAYTRELLTQHSVVLDFENLGEGSENPFQVDLLLTNKAGHKFPSGYPERRAWIELLITGDEGAGSFGDTLFHSGAWDPSTFEILGQEDVIQSIHHDLISDQGLTQIYELVLGDVNGDLTTLLEQAYAPLKDNRLVPAGFSSTHPAYDTTAVIGAALLDDDFNLNSDGIEGAGTDRITYDFSEAIAGIGPGSISCNITAKLWYQSIPPKWVAPMFDMGQALDDSTILAFKTLYATHPPIPELVTEVSQEFLAIGVEEEVSAELFNVSAFPNPTVDGRITIESDALMQYYSLHDAAGRMMDKGQLNQRRLLLMLPSRGTYMLRLQTDQGEVVRRLVRS